MSELVSRSRRQEQRAWRVRWRRPALSRRTCEAILSADADSGTVGDAHRTLAWLDKWKGDFDSAEAHVRAALRSFGAVQRYAVGDVQAVLAVILYSRGDYAKAHVACEDGLDAIAGLPHQETRVDLLVTLATLYQYSGDFAHCHELLDEAISIARQHGDTLDEARIEHNRARALLRQTDMPGALSTARQCYRLAQTSRNRVIEPYACEVLGTALIEHDRAAEALVLLGKGEEMSEHLGDIRAWCQNLEQTGRAYTALGRHSEANAALERGLEFAEAMKYPLWIHNFSRDLSRNFEAAGNYREALRCERAYIAAHREIFSIETERRLSDMRNAFELREAQARIARESLRAIELAEAARVSEEANKLKTRFLANMSHELRTPLNAILGFVQVLQLSELTEKQREYTDIVLTAGQTLLSLVSDILDLTQIEAGIAIDLKPFDLNDVVQEASATAHGLLSNKPVEFRIDIEDTIQERIVGDQSRVAQILVNLIGNAAKFSDSGTITLAARNCTEGIRLSIIDNGPGVRPEHLEKIFLRFQQGSDEMTKKHGGTGLGLAICKELVHRMNGTIGVDNVEGGGSEFWITLPVEATEPVRKQVSENRALKSLAL